MKTTASILFSYLIVQSSTIAQNGQIWNLTKISEETVTPARILNSIPDGISPPPSPPMPEFSIPKRGVLETVTHEQGGRTITIRKIKPIDLPPPPVGLVASEQDSEFSRLLTAYRTAHPRSGLLFLGATVFRSKHSPPRTLVRYWPEGKREDITFWSSADFALIAGGIHSFLDSASNPHSIFMGWGNVDIEQMTDLQAAKRREYYASNVPDFPEGKATFEIVGKQPAAEDLPPIQAIHDIYHSELARLQKAFEGREKARLEHEAELKANPPTPQNITLNYWRTEKPASKEKGGATR